MNISPQMAIADVLFEHDDLTVAEIIERAEVELSARQAALILFDAVRRRHVIRLARIGRGDSNDRTWVYSLTLLGRQAAPLICSPKALLRKPVRKPRTTAHTFLPIPANAEPTAVIPKHLLRVLALAARESGHALQGELREAIELALREAA